MALTAMTMTSAPAFADGPGRWRHHRHHDGGLDVGALIGGLAVVGAGAALIGAVNRSEQRRYDDRYAPPPPPPPPEDDYGWRDGDGYADDRYDDDGGWNPAAVESEDRAVDVCAISAERQGREYADSARVVDIVDVDRDARGWVIDGTVELTNGYRDAAREEARFRCAVTFAGLSDVRIDGFDTAGR
ncbi:hypothetical protein D1610_06380 [Sphingomonas gilva]|uniref:Uncharacterized protein n=1 Tax=Sphingomonas gilva TaxID=2305907 RepID=A0A396RNR4_9SPHN|nr:hypothetical protein D1610_06380 [Sphingomonas gilva]